MFLYCVRIYNYDRALKNAITTDNVISFLKLYNETKSEYRMWFNNNINKINSFYLRDDNGNKIFEYFEIDIKKKLYNKFTFKNKSVNPLQNIYKLQSIITQAGGNNDEIFYCFLYSIVFYLFQRSGSDENNINKMSGGGEFTSVSVIAEQEDDITRIMCLVKVKFNETDYEYVLKITPQKEKQYTYERDIYLELNNSLQYNNNILKMKSYGAVQFNSENKTIYFNFQESNNIFNAALKNPDNLNIIELITDFKENNGNLSFIATEYLSNYDILESILAKNMYNKTTLCTLVKDIIDCLRYLNKTYGFCHLDLHTGNLLIDKANITDYKIYDFDYSYTNNNKNFIISNQINEFNIDNKNIIQKGFIFDCVKLYYEIVSKKSEYKDMCRNEIPLIQKIDQFIKHAKFDEHTDVDVLMKIVNIIYNDQEIKDLFFPFPLIGGNKYMKYKSEYLKLVHFNNIYKRYI